MIASEDDKWILDGWSIDAFKSRKAAGVGVAKDIMKLGVVEIDAGVYATIPTIDFIKTRVKLLQYNAGVSVALVF